MLLLLVVAVVVLLLLVRWRLLVQRGNQRRLQQQPWRGQERLQAQRGGQRRVLLLQQCQGLLLLGLQAQWRLACSLLPGCACWCTPLHGGAAVVGAAAS